MKKLYWVNILLILILLVSCRTVKQNDEVLVNTAIQLGNKYYETDRLQEALDVYNSALESGYDFKLLYNKSIIQAEMQDYEGAILTAELALDLYEEHSELKTLLAKYYCKNGSTEKAYSIALEMWDSGNTSSDVLEVLYSVNSAEWETLYRVLQNQQS